MFLNLNALASLGNILPILDVCLYSWTGTAM